MRPSITFILIAILARGVAWSAEPAQTKPPAAPAAQPAEKAPEQKSAEKLPEQKSAEKAPDATEEKSADTKQAEPKPDAKSPADVKASPQRFIPSEQVRADFDVSFPIDI
jgi:hypothetical protein